MDGRPISQLLWFVQSLWAHRAMAGNYAIPQGILEKTDQKSERTLHPSQFEILHLCCCTSADSQKIARSTRVGSTTRTSESHIFLDGAIWLHALWTSLQDSCRWGRPHEQNSWANPSSPNVDRWDSMWSMLEGILHPWQAEEPFDTFGIMQTTAYWPEDASSTRTWTWIDQGCRVTSILGWSSSSSSSWGTDSTCSLSPWFWTGECGALWGHFITDCGVWRQWFWAPRDRSEEHHLQSSYLLDYLHQNFAEHTEHASSGGVRSWRGDSYPDSTGYWPPLRPRYLVLPEESLTPERTYANPFWDRTGICANLCEESRYCNPSTPQQGAHLPSRIFRAQTGGRSTILHGATFWSALSWWHDSLCCFGRLGDQSAVGKRTTPIHSRVLDQWRSLWMGLRCPLRATLRNVVAGPLRDRAPPAESWSQTPTRQWMLVGVRLFEPAGSTSSRDGQRTFALFDWPALRAGHHGWFWSHGAPQRTRRSRETFDLAFGDLATTYAVPRRRDHRPRARASWCSLSQAYKVARPQYAVATSTFERAPSYIGAAKTQRHWQNCRRCVAYCSTEGVPTFDEPRLGCGFLYLVPRPSSQHRDDNGSSFCWQVPCDDITHFWRHHWAGLRGIRNISNVERPNSPTCQQRRKSQWAVLKKTLM